MGAVTKCSQFVMIECQGLGLDANWCRKTDLSPHDRAEIADAAKASFGEAKKQEAAGTINGLANLKDDKVYLFSGTYDGIVPQGVMDALYHFYSDADKASLESANIHYSRSFPAPHTMVRDGFDKPSGGVVGSCAPAAPSFKGNSFIDDCEYVAKREQKSSSCDCTNRTLTGSSAAGAVTETACPPTDHQAVCKDLQDVDLAGAILSRIYGGQALKGGRVAVSEDGVQAFDQRKVFSKLSGAPANALQNASMAKEGYIFIPKNCKDGRSCKLHVAFHGCLQGGKTDRRPGHSGNLYSKFAGYNEWAKANGIIVLYPQVEARSASGPLNPQGCWDWWGQNYTHEGYHTQHGTQIRAVAQMIDILAGEQQLLDVPAE